MESPDAALIEKHRSLVVAIASKVRAQFDLAVDLDELIAFGFRGLLEAHSRFDPSRGAQFSTFAYYRIRGAVIDGVREMAYMPRRAHSQLRAAEAALRVTEEVAQARESAPEARADLEATAQTLDSTLHRMAAAFVLAHASSEAPVETPEDALLRASVVGELHAAIDALPERERKLVRGFYFEGRQFDAVADELGVSRSWASRLHGKALDRLRRVLSGEAEKK